jgi:hypothetical protein
MLSRREWRTHPACCGNAGPFPGAVLTCKELLDADDLRHAVLEFFRARRDLLVI